MIRSDFRLENKLLSEGYELVIGIDEAGRGPLAGPVVAGAVVLKQIDAADENFALFDLIRDSKTLSAKQREKMFAFIHEHFHVGVGVVDHQTIDRINILEASFLAMKAALTDLKAKFRYDGKKHIVVVDGNKKIPNVSLYQKAVPGGDKFVKSISAASIIAKVTRDRLMLTLHEKYPEYDFRRHKGYGTQAHMAAIQKYGPCAIHRCSFEPVKSLAKKQK